MATVYTDDPDAYVTFTVRSADGANVDWSSPVVAIGPGDYQVAATWLGDPAPSRQIKVPIVGLAVNSYRLYLRVPNGTDIKLGDIRVSARS